MTAKIPKIRADMLLVQRGLAESRTRAQALIMSGKVLQNDKPIQKSGDLLAEDVALRIKGRGHDWVGRGGVKLSAALEHWQLDISDKICADIGASTGGFCDVLLQAGAAKIYAVDVGRGQLHERLRQDARLVIMDNTNARHLTAEDFAEPPEVITCDVSFISLQKALAALLQICREVKARTGQKTELIALIKPQFQLQKGEVGKGGIVKDSSLQQRACDEVADWLKAEGLSVKGILPSPIEGTQGNKEFLIYGIL